MNLFAEIKFVLFYFVVFFSIFVIRVSVM